MPVRPARPDDFERLRAIELSAGRLFVDVGMPDIAEHEPPTVEELWSAPAVLVAVDDDDRPVGYAMCVRVDGQPHLEQISVDPAASRQGHGAALLDAVQAWAGGEAVTLTTFTDVPWNRPYYERHGYVVVPPDEWTPALRDLVAHEATFGLDPTTRVVMRRSA